MKKIQKISASILLMIFLSSLVSIAPVKASTAKRTIKPKTNNTAQHKKPHLILKPAPKPTAAEIKAAKQQAIMERSYAGYVKDLLGLKKHKKIKKVAIKKKKAKKVAKK